LESELFGYEEGAFTGAKKGGQAGKFELARGGTVFLDEIGEMPLNCQVSLLRILQEKQVVRIGGITPVPLDVRVIAATNKDLEKEVKQGNFRLDLYYRLNVLTIDIPALRERKEDIISLAHFFLDKLTRELGKDKMTIAPDLRNGY
jgi:transcriptional regulator with PAS, ATPase and Fis domain